MSTPDEIGSGRVLYFPTIVFQSDAWLKSALCVWDKVYRICPPGYSPRDSDETKQAIDAGLVETIPLSKEDLATTADQFEKMMENAIAFPAALQGHENVRLHSEKIDARLLPLLEELNAVVNSDGWLSVSEDVANAYMLFLSRTVARRRGIAAVTDNDDVFTAFTYFGFDGNFDDWVTNPDAEDVAATLVLPTLLPAGIEDSAMREVLAIRSRYQDARIAYRRTIESLAKRVSEISDRGHARELLREFDDSLKSGRATGGAIKIPDLSAVRQGFLSAGIPAAAGALAGGTGTGWGIAGAAAAVAVVGTMAHALGESRKIWKKSDAFYHLELHRRLSVEAGPEGPMPRYRRLFHEFMDD